MSSVVHDSFSIERIYPVAPAKVFAAWTTLEGKKQWFGNEEGLEAVGEQSLDFRIGGREHFAAKAEGKVFEFDATYCDIVENERIVWTYDMQMDGQRISVSLATIEIAGAPGGARLVMTEQGAFLDGLDTNEQRRAGTEQFLDTLATFLVT